ncbi:MAG: DNA repair protein RecN [Chloroflexi bacterium GWB2_49_20]|nr:MAG: DNA repair protein RecN [Chloroflexi bacterium GWB2_49_20]OGN80396.1 MAG: DNA repair protein RecN [Chloroflexi bacterium GWC2_49_37]OGN84294.1 MAG: DNA repair protein RecN [Chloroflexi bacterium GWD2_49_16]
MLNELRILNFAIIDQLDLTFESGLLIFTGETGAGKSIIMDAVEMLLGGRADATVIRAEADLARVEATFKLEGSQHPAVHELLKREELLDDENFVTISREVRREGRSVARINGRTVNQTLLRELGGLLVDIHGQSEHLSLLDIRSHLGLLDRFAKLESALAAYRLNHQKIGAIRRELKEVLEAQQDAERRTEMLTYQAEEIEAARLHSGEEDELRNERDRLANAESLTSLAQQSLTFLDEGTPETPAATDLLGQVSQALTNLSRIDSSQAGLSDQASALEENLADMAHSLRDYLEGIEFNPKRLEAAEERLNLIQAIKRKFGGSIEAALAFASDARHQLDGITHASERIASLQEAESELLKELASQAVAISNQRKQAAADLSKRIEAELEDLRMASAQFKVDFQTQPDPHGGLPMPDGQRLAFDSNGMDRVEFLVAPNPGEGLKPLVKVASGGETSRLMLALKNVLASADQVPTLIFDEIDQGIGGRVGTVVGEKLWQLARQHQVLVITHLPQLAAFGDQHWQVHKLLENERTITRVTHLQGEARTLELAGMLGEVTEGTLLSAQDILQLAQKARQGKN